jgi:metal-responsive CopG/Arc/MetJ family transcriptional regulator
MKTAVSLPDSLFERAERVAQQLNLNRSQLFARALEDYLDRNDPETMTAAFNRVYATESSELDPQLWQLQLQSIDELADDEW